MEDSKLEKLEVMPLMSVKELSQWIRLKPKTVYDWVETDRIPYCKVGSRVLFNRNDVQGWLNSLQRGPNLRDNDNWETASEMKR